MSNKIDINRKSSYIKPDSIRDILEITLLAIATAGLLYFCYFQMAPWIWSQSMPFNPADITPWIIPWLEDRDGIELYVLYALMFLNLLLAYALTYRWTRLAGRRASYFLMFAFVVACAFLGSVGLHPPMSTFADHVASDIFARSFMVMLVILPITALLCYLQKHSTSWAIAVVALLLIPICFISTTPFSWYDYGYIFAPALRLFHGNSISEIYFQYDLLLSLIGLVWMKLQLDLNLFQVVGQCSYYLLLLGLFVFSREWFLDKCLSVFMLIAIVLARIYIIGPYDIIQFFQVTPLRLDMWLILLLLVYFKGPYHWGAGLFCALLLLLHTNFGIIYSAAYIQLLLTLSIIDTAAVSGKPIQTALSVLGDFFKKNYHNLAIILMGVMAHYLLFMNTDVQSNFYYPRLGIGFMKISTHSFYWYAVAVSGLSFVLLLMLRTKVSRAYLATGFCLIYLAIGNSLYFFGRSHENNIINISVILLLLFFFLVDVVGRTLINSQDKSTRPFIHRNMAIIISLAFITLISIFYGDSITNKLATQVHNASVGQLHYPSLIPEQQVVSSLASVRAVTGDNPNVYFVLGNGFYYEYYGGYAPVGYFNPLTAWISRPEFNRFLQGLVDRGYFLVVGDRRADMVSAISFSNYKHSGGFVIVWK